MIDLDNLRTFLHVAERGSFSAAAESLHLTQPAVSKRIAALEETLGLRLFDRVGRRIRLTEAGRVLQPKAGGLLRELADIRRTLSNLSREVAGDLSLGTSHHIGLRRLPPVLRHYHQHYPAVRLDIRFMDSETACTEVERGTLELGVVTLPISPPATLEMFPLWDDPLFFAVGRDHPLAGATRVRLEDLLRHPAVLPAQGTYTRAVLERETGPKGLRIHERLATNYLETIKMLVAVGLGWSLLPGTLLDGEIRTLDVDGLRLRRTLGAVRRRGRSPSNAAEAMLDTCRRVARERAAGANR